MSETETGSRANIARVLLSGEKDITNVDFKGKRVLVRVDFNVPVQDGVVMDYARVDAALPTIKALQRKGARVVLMSHLGRPKPKTMGLKEMKKAFSLDVLTAKLQEELGDAFKGVTGTTVGDVATASIASLHNGQVLLLENTRFNAGDEASDPEFSLQLAHQGDVFVNDAFGVCHRDQASVTGVTKHVKEKYPGLLVRLEVQYLMSKIDNPARPYAVVIGGSKVPDKIGVLWKMIEQADKILIGGRMAYTFLATQGVSLGSTHIEHAWTERAGQMIQAAKDKGVELFLPIDVLNTYDLDSNVPCCTRPLNSSCCSAESPCVPDGAFGADIGPATATLYREALVTCNTIFMNGPMGRFEMEAYSHGTSAVVRALVEASDAGATTIVGGGDSALAVKQLGLTHKISHLSTGGGASLELIEGKVMPGFRALVVSNSD